jgi:N-acetylated-alpha-linked acidic dipeptidase
MNKFLPVLLITCAVQSSIATPQKITGFYEKNIAKQLTLESSFDKNLNKEKIGETIKILSSKPHHVGSAKDKENAEYIRDQFIKWGWDAKIETFYVLFPTPRTRVLEMIAPTTYKAVLKEPALKEDATSGQPGELPTYNAFSADGDVTAGLIFANYGLPEDYETLDKMGIDVKGKIVITKYGRSWRGIKPKVAQEHGAAGCIIYSDPADDGYFQGDVYPKGAFRNEYGVQRGSVVDMPVYPGDPLTPGISATRDAKRLERSEAPSLLKIPVLPISYHDAAPLLGALTGQVAPEEWHGGLPFAFHIGQGDTKVHLRAEFNWDIVECYDIVATITGSEFPDEWIIRGNHHDAWVYGAGDPLSGQAALLEEARSIGTLLKTGWKPKRTIVYCAWDGEEPGLLGSTEWVELHEQELKEKGVIYINSDGNGRGFLYAGGSSSLEPLIDEVAKQVADPQTGVSVFDRVKDHEAIAAKSAESKKNAWNEKELELGALGSGSDYSSFLQHVGIPSLNLGFGGEDDGGEYHSIYDSYNLYEKFKDPGFQYGVTLAETVGHMVLRMSESDVLPFDFMHQYNTIEKYSSELVKLLQATRESTELENVLITSGAYSAGNDPLKGFKLPVVKQDVPYLDFSPLQNALQKLEKSTGDLCAVYQNNIKAGSVSAEFNKSLFRAERQLLLESGLPRRPWYRHSLYAPGFYTGYGVKTMPGIREAIEQRNWTEAQQEIETDAKVLTRLAEYFTTLAAIKN